MSIRHEQSVLAEEDWMLILIEELLYLYCISVEAPMKIGMERWDYDDYTHG